MARPLLHWAGWQGAPCPTTAAARAAQTRPCASRGCAGRHPGAFSFLACARDGSTGDDVRRRSKRLRRPQDAETFATPGAVALPASMLDRLARTPGVERAGAISDGLSVLTMHGRQIAVLLIGSDPGRIGGPLDMADGSAATSTG
jgi:hypothetical protein